MAWARITAINSENDTADIVILNKDLNPLETLDGEGKKITQTHINVPIFYHCSPEATLRDNGSLMGASDGFSVDDNVIVKFIIDDFGSKIEHIIMGHLGKKKFCNKVLYLIDYYFIPPSTNPLYKITAFKIKSDFTLDELHQDQAANKLSLSARQDGGFHLVVQGNPTSNQVYVAMPFHGELWESIDKYRINLDTNTLTYKKWGDTATVMFDNFPISPVVGSDENYQPKVNSLAYEIVSTLQARRGYSTDSTGKLDEFGFEIESTNVGGVKRLNFLEGWIERTLQKYRIGWYYASDAIKHYTDWAFQETGGQNWNPAGTGDPNVWKVYMPIVAIASDKMLIKSIDKTTTTGGGSTTIQGKYYRDFEIKRAYCNGSEAVFYSANPYYYRNETVGYGLNTNTFTEELKIGAGVIESLTYIENIYLLDSFNLLWAETWTRVGGLIFYSANDLWTSKDLITSYTITAPIGLDAAGTISDITNGSTIVSQPSPMGTCSEQSKPYSYSTIEDYTYTGGYIDKRTGEKDIFVMAMDNLQGDENFIIIYGLGSVDYIGNYSTDQWTMDVPVSDNYATTFKMVYKVNGGAITKVDLAENTRQDTYKCVKCMNSFEAGIKEITEYTTTTNGTKIGNVSVQINAGFISFTYCVYNITDDVETFNKRVIGLISINDNKYPAGVIKQWEYTGSDYDKKSAIGVVR